VQTNTDVTLEWQELNDRDRIKEREQNTNAEGVLAMPKTKTGARAASLPLQTTDSQTAFARMETARV
jgi:hypothetical protein